MKMELKPCKYCKTFPHVAGGDVWCKIKCERCGQTVNDTILTSAIKKWNKKQED